MLKSFSAVANETYDVCVCGSGPAGITIARSLASRGKHVALVEAGGAEYTDASQNIYEGENVGLEYWGLTACRLRYFGGTSGHWSGRCALFDPIDFEDRAYHGMPGWPIDRDDVLAYLKPACDILDLGEQSLRSPKHSKLENSLFRMSGFAHSPPTRFGEKYKEELEQSKNVDVYLNANVTDIHLEDAAPKVRNIILKTLAGEETSLRARCFVIAFGAIENARILLNSNKQIPSGLGNDSDLVGRCFMEHLNVPYGRFVTSDAAFWQTGSASFMPTPRLMRKANIGNGVIAFQADAKPRSYGRLRALKQAMREAACLSDTVADISRNFVDYNCAGDGIISSLCEQSPNLESRVMLGEERDVLGLRRVKLNWRLNDADRKTIRKLGMDVAKEVARLNIARVQLSDFILDEDKEIKVGGHCHHMGTTRMAADPRDGVVDQNSRVHGIDNLYLAGSSVFPTSGGANPTLTIVMLALRLANHLTVL